VQSDTAGYDRARDSLTPRLPYIPYRATHKTETTFSPQTIPQNCTNSAPLLCCFLGQTNSHLDSHLPVFLPFQTLLFCVLETSLLPQQQPGITLNANTITNSNMSDVIPPSRPRTFRRLSSSDATTADFSLKSPTVVVPPQHLMDPSDAHEVAAAMELARLDLEDSDGPDDPSTPVESSVTDKFAFAFDIDGVLIRGGRPIPEAIEAMKVLNGKNQYGIKM
jgi:hypothetical protein